MANTQQKDYDPYVILQVERDCSIEDIKTKYRRLSLIQHTDKSGDLTFYYKVRESYDLLIDRKARYCFDECVARNYNLRLCWEVVSQYLTQQCKEDQEADRLAAGQCKQQKDEHVANLKAEAENKKLEEELAIIRKKKEDRANGLERQNLIKSLQQQIDSLQKETEKLEKDLQSEKDSKDQIRSVYTEAIETEQKKSEEADKALSQWFQLQEQLRKDRFVFEKSQQDFVKEKEKFDESKLYFAEDKKDFEKDKLELEKVTEKIDVQQSDLNQQKEEFVRQKEEFLKTKEELMQQKELIQQKEELIQQKEELIQQKEELIQQKEEIIQQKEELIQQKEELIQQKEEFAASSSQMFNTQGGVKRKIDVEFIELIDLKSVEQESDKAIMIYKCNQCQRIQMRHLTFVMWHNICQHLPKFAQHVKKYSTEEMFSMPIVEFITSRNKITLNK